MVRSGRNWPASAFRLPGRIRNERVEMERENENEKEKEKEKEKERKNHLGLLGSVTWGVGLL